jgi:hypothetical protein
MSLFNTLRRALGVNAGDDLQDETQMNPFDQAGLTGNETTGTVAGATNVNTGALPQSVVDNATQTQTTIPTETTGAQPTGQVGGQVAGQGAQTTGTKTGTQAGTGTQPPPLATPGIVGGGNTFSPQFIAGGGGSPYVSVLGDQIVTTTDEKGQKSKSIQDLIEIGGTGFDDEVLARKLRRQAGMPELKNEDYYPNQPFTQAQTAWGDPIFSGAGALFPMAAYDAQRKARAQAEIDEAKRNVMQIKIPEIKTGAYVEMVKSGFTNDVTNLTNEYVKKYGGPKKAIQAMRQDGSLANLQARWEGVAKSIDQTADRAKEFLKNAQEKSTTMYFSPEGVRAATNFMNGMDAFSKGEITPDMLNQLEQQFRTAERWSDYKEREMKLLTADEKIPTAEQMNAQPSQEDKASFQEQLKLPGATQDYQTWIFVKKYTDLNKKKVMEGIVLPFFSQNPTAMEQLANENETPAQTADRIAESILALRGREIEVGQREKNPRGGISIRTTSGGQKQEKTYYQSIDERKAEIMKQAKEMKPANVAQAKQFSEQIFGGGTADELIFGTKAFDWPTINESIASMPYSELYEPNATDFNTKQEVFFGRVNKTNAGISSNENTAKNLKIQSVITGFVSKGKDGQVRIYSNLDATKKPLTDDYKPYLIQVVTDEKYETSESDIDVTDLESLIVKMNSTKKSPAKSGIYYRFVPLDRTTATTYDKKADKSTATTGGTSPQEIEVSGSVENL